MNISQLGIISPLETLTIIGIYLIITIYSIYHLIRNKKIKGYIYIIYILIIISVPIIGSLIYLIHDLNEKKT